MRFLNPQTFGLLAIAGIATASFSQAVLAQPSAGPAHLFDFAAIDTDKDGKVTPAEVESYRLAQITAMDSDQDGNISSEEMAAHHMGLMRQSMQARAQEHAKEMIDTLDADKDGAVSIAEMANRPQMSDRMFNRLDSDEDGAISQAEADEAMAKMAKRGGWHQRGGHDDHEKGKGGFGGFW